MHTHGLGLLTYHDVPTVWSLTPPKYNSGWFCGMPPLCHRPFSKAAFQSPVLVKSWA